MADHLELRALVDEVSVLADKKDFVTQVQLFTEDAVTEITTNGETLMQLAGREAMAQAFENFNKSFTAAFHLNGQHVVSVNVNLASGTLYCFVSLISLEDGHKVKSTIGAVYEDEYMKINGKWLISARRGNFIWQDKTILS
ncbi:nuclear transport factor 2 family protein [uncultured Mucilaginibacter sp.]|nr:nuclear transport factor 2 family protein [uncultured Mucilaginibacter sp.]OJW18599.1 MAG: hypothetical protein BGO48_17705 [Mucilaginibacter sp. 44-25]PLW88314.1 MAG: bile acid 7-alpha-dehydratase [Mucilaginibacter sp.]PMP65218.1 MAG: bile acid 7-alpha-dehydratase [Mucilaginibacter sp.]HEK19515.1 nuclear transport factor 2 family protein [Bacteroidota bacterium]